MLTSKLLSNAIKSALGLKLEHISPARTYSDAVRMYNVGTRLPSRRPALDLPFFTDAVEADEFYYPKHLRGCAAGRVYGDELLYAKHIPMPILPHHFVTRVLPKDAVPIEDMNYNSIPLVIREQGEVLRKMKREIVDINGSKYIRYLYPD